MVNKLSKAISSTAGSFLLLFSGLSNAVVTGEPLPFDQFTATDGTISASCGNWTNASGQPMTVTCGAPLISDGMMQREVYVSSSDANYNGTYIQFVLVDSGASGNASAANFSTGRGSLYFTSEDFIKMNNRGGGIASKQTILESSFNAGTLIEDRFAMDTTYKNGWAQGVATVDPWVEVYQEVQELQYDADISVATSATELFDTNFSMKAVPGTVGYNESVDINQRVLLKNNNPADDAIQKFKHSRLGGVFQPTQSDIVIPPIPPVFGGATFNTNPILPGGTNSGVVTWLGQETLSATWIGVDNLNPNSSSIDSTFGLNKFRNETSGMETSKLSFVDPEAASAWSTIVNLNAGQLLFPQPPLMADSPLVALTDASVMNPNTMLGAANLDYIPNSSATLPASTGGLYIADSDYNNWTVSSGIFNVPSCPVWADACSNSTINEGGMFQRWITAGGEQYLQTIIVADGSTTGDPNAADFTANSLAFKMESFVKAGAGNGIASSMKMAERGTNTTYLSNPTATVDMPNDAGDFIHSVAQNTGWANVGSVFVSRDMNGNGVIAPGEGITEPQATIAIDQYLFVPDNGAATNAVNYDESFTMEVGPSQSDKRITMASHVGTQGAWVGPIDYRSVTVSGAYQRTSHNAMLDPFVLPGNSKNMSWSAGDALQATWVGGDYGVTPVVPNAHLSSTSFRNRTTGERISYTDVINIPTGPDNWLVDPFLAAPIYSGP